MLSIIDLEILILALNEKIILYTVVTQKNIINKVFVLYKYKDKYNWYLNWNYTYSKAKIKYNIPYYKTDKNSKIDYIIFLALHLQNKL